MSQVNGNLGSVSKPSWSQVDLDLCCTCIRSCSNRRESYRPLNASKSIPRANHHRSRLDPWRPRVYQDSPLRVCYAPLIVVRSASRASSSLTLPTRLKRSIHYKGLNSSTSRSTPESANEELTRLSCLNSLILSRTGRLILPSSSACVRRSVASVYDSALGRVVLVVPRAPGCTGVSCIMMLFSRFVAFWMGTGLPVAGTMADMAEFVKLIERRGDFALAVMEPSQRINILETPVP